MPSIARASSYSRGTRKNPKFQMQATISNFLKTKKPTNANILCKRNRFSLLSARCNLCLGLLSLIFLFKIKVYSNFSYYYYLHNEFIHLSFYLFFYSLSYSFEYSNIRYILTVLGTMPGRKYSIMNKTDKVIPHGIYI